jgi:hypothetical protein
MGYNIILFIKLLVFLNTPLSVIIVTSTKSYKLNFHTSYNQFYIGDKDYKGNTGSSTFWSKEAFSDRLAVDKDVLGIGIGSYGHVKGEVLLVDKLNPNTNLNKYDHVVEGSLQLVSGFLQITNCPDNEIELTLKLKPGIYKVRIYSSNLRNTGLDDEEGSDLYRIEICPGNSISRRVLKRHMFQ